MTEVFVSPGCGFRARIAEAAKRLGGALARSRRSRRRTTAGLSIFGVMLGGLLAAAAMIWIVDLYQGAREDQNRDQAIALLQRLRGSVERVYAGSPNYGASQTNLVPILASRGLIPDSAMVGAGNTATIRHGFGGAVTILGNPGGSSPTQFRITFAGVEGEVCAALADVFVGRTRARTGIVSIVFNSTAVTAPVTRANVTSNCNAFPAAGANLSFQFG